MITDRSQYRYVGGDLSQVVVNGGIMPLRPAADKKLLRGEDVAFLLEGAWERLAFWQLYMQFDKYGNMTRTSNDYWRVPNNDYPFQKVVYKINGNGTIYDAHGKIGSMYGGLYSEYTDSSLVEVPYQDSAIVWPETQPYLNQSKRTVRSFDGLLLDMSRIEGEFSDISRPKFYHFNLNPTQAYNIVTESGSLTRDDPGYSADIYGQCYGTWRGAQFAAVSIVSSASFKSVRVYGEFRLWAHYNTGSGDDVRTGRYWIQDITSMVRPEQNRYFYDPHNGSGGINKGWITDTIRECGFPVYTYGDCVDEHGDPTGKFCLYDLEIENIYIQYELNPRTVWT